MKLFTHQWLQLGKETVGHFGLVPSNHGTHDYDFFLYSFA